MKLLEQKAADDGTDQADGDIAEKTAASAKNECAPSQPATRPMMIQAMMPMTRALPYAALGGMRWFGVELEIFTSSSFMSTPTSPNSGVDR